MMVTGHKSCENLERQIAARLRRAWRCEINQDYDLHLVMLRSEQDLKNLTDKRYVLIQNLKEGQLSNINLRKEVRALEKEIEIMRQKNAQKSCVIDSLQVIDNQSECTKLLNWEKKDNLQIGAKNLECCEQIIHLLRCDVSLLRNRQTCFPHKFKNNLLDTLTLDDHQKSQRRIQEMMHIPMEKIRKFHSDFNEFLCKHQEKRIWIEELFQLENVRPDTSKLIQGETIQEEISQDEIIPEKIIPDEIIQEEIIQEDFTNLIMSQLGRMGRIMDDLAEGIAWLKELRCDQYLIENFTQQLMDLLRKKQEPACQVDHQYLDEMDIMMDIHVKEGAMISRFLNEYTTHILEDFLLNEVYGYGTKKDYFKKF